MDDNFSSIVKAVMWGRSVFDNIRKFLQFQLTVNVVALVITFISAITGADPPINAVMMLWINLIMDTMGALALGTEAPSPTLLDRRPYKRDAPLISSVMWRNILTQSIFQIGLLSYLLTQDGATDFGVDFREINHQTVVFNTFVICQIFNEFNARSIGDTFDIFQGLFGNPIFIGVIVVTIIVQYFIVEQGGSFVGTCHLNEEQWYRCILLASLTIPVGGIMRLIPISEGSDSFSGKVLVDAPAKASLGFSVTFLIWITAVSLSIAAVFQEFSPRWSPRFEVYFSS
jgi:P-type Ca2+ transporter type 2C